MSAAVFNAGGTGELAISAPGLPTFAETGLFSKVTVEDVPNVQSLHDPWLLRYTAEHVGVVRRAESQSHDEPGAEQVAAAMRVRGSCNALRAGEWRGVDLWVRMVCAEVDSASAGMPAASVAPLTYPLPEHSPMWAAILDPGFTLPMPAPPPSAPVQAAGALSEGELDHYAALAGWPNEPGWWPEMKLIIGCESGRNPNAHNGSDPNGGSSGLTQLNGRSHFDKAGEDFEMRFDPVVNLRTALWLRTVRGHFGGSGGWKNCAARFGIP